MDEPIHRTVDFIASEGVDTHISYTDGAYANIGQIIADLAWLGIDNVRDGFTIAPGQRGTPTIAAYETLAAAGVKFVLNIAGGGDFAATGGTPTDPSLDQRLGYIAELAQAAPGSVVAVEGANEINNFPLVYDGQGATGVGTDELDAALALQTNLYASVHADHALAGVKVYYFTGYGAGAIPQGPDPAVAPGLADADTQHPYPTDGLPPAAFLARSQALGNETPADAAAGAPVVYTETGYSSVGGTAGGVNADVQAKYTLDLFLDAQKNNVVATYLYDLLDAYAPGSPQGDDGFGLFDYLGAPKPVAIDLRAMNAILADPGADARSFTLAYLAYGVVGETATGDDLELAKSDGTTVIALWDEQPIWDAATGTEIAVPPHVETVALGDGTSSYDVAEYDPTRGAAAIATEAGVKSMSVAVSDHPVFLEINLACYREGTRIRTAAGEAPIETLRAGDRVALARGGAAVLRWVGHRRATSRSHAQPAEIWPVRVAAGAFGPRRPSRDLFLSPDHAVFVGGVLIPIRHLVDGGLVAQRPVEDVTYWHVELDHHDVILAEDLPCESFLDTGNRAAFVNGAAGSGPAPHAAEAWRDRACAPLVEGGEMVAALRDRLAARAAAQGVRVTPTLTVPLAPGEVRALVPAGAENLRLLSAGRRRGADRRRLGALVTGIWLDAAPLPLDDERLGSGFHTIEMHGGKPVRWTDGAATLVLGPACADRHVAIEVATVAPA